MRHRLFNLQLCKQQQHQQQQCRCKLAAPCSSQEGFFTKPRFLPTILEGTVLNDKQLQFFAFII
jgi:hypothetical protein